MAFEPARRQLAEVTSEMGAFSLEEGASVLRAYAGAQQGTIDLSVRVGADANQLRRLRGRAFLPYPVADEGGSKVIAVIAQGAAAQAARDAGATHVGTTELVNEILAGNILPTRLLAAPDTVDLLRRNKQVATFLGPKGLMPSEKRGSVIDASSMAAAVAEAKGGLDWAAEQSANESGIGHIGAAIGKLSHLPTEVLENIVTLLKEVASTAQASAQSEEAKQAARPQELFKSISITNEPGEIRVDLDLAATLQALAAAGLQESTVTAKKPNPLFPEKLSKEEAWLRLIKERRRHRRRFSSRP